MVALAASETAEDSAGLPMGNRRSIHIILPHRINVFADYCTNRHKCPYPLRRIYHETGTEPGLARPLFAVYPSVQIRHRAATAGAEGAAAGAGGAAVGALPHAVGPHRVHRPAAVAAAGSARSGPIAGVARRLTHSFQCAGGLGEQGQREEFIVDTMLPLKRQLKIGFFFRRDSGVQCQV